MSIFTEQEAKALLDKVLALSKADECTVSLSGSVDGNIRFALNNISTSGIVSNADLAVQSSFGKRVGTATINEFDDAALERVVRRAEELARQQQEQLQFTARLVTMGEMASTLAHELNQPLAAIASYSTGCLNLMESIDCQTDEIRPAIEKIGLQAQRAGKRALGVNCVTRRAGLRGREILFKLRSGKRIA